MANLLTITKKPNGYFDFVVNGDTANIVTNDRNDMTGVGNFTHFKMFNGASTIKQQNITFGNVTLIDGVALPPAVSMDDLISKLASIDFYAWRDASGSGGVNRFDELLDTFDYFGQDGKTAVVDESQLKLIPVNLPDVSGLAVFPATLVANKYLQVNSAGTAYGFVDLPSGTALVPVIQFVGDGVTTTFDTGSLAQINAIFREGALLDDSDWSQTGTAFTILTFVPAMGERLKPI